MHVQGSTHFDSKIQQYQVVPPQSNNTRWTVVQALSGIAFVVSTIGVAIILIVAQSSPLLLGYSGIALFFIPSFAAGASLTLLILSSYIKERRPVTVIQVPMQSQQHTQSAQETQTFAQAPVVQAVVFQEAPPTKADKQEISTTLTAQDIFNRLDQAVAAACTFISKVFAHHASLKGKEKDLSANLHAIWDCFKNFSTKPDFVLTQMLLSMIRPKPILEEQRNLISDWNEGIIDANSEDKVYDLLSACNAQNDLLALTMLYTDFSKSKEKDRPKAFIVGLLEILYSKKETSYLFTGKLMGDKKLEIFKHISDNFSSYAISPEQMKLLSIRIVNFEKFLKKDLFDKSNNNLLDWQANLGHILFLIAHIAQQDEEVKTLTEELIVESTNFNNPSSLITTYLQPFFKNVQVILRALNHQFFAVGKKEIQLELLFASMLAWENRRIDDPLNHNSPIAPLLYKMNKDKAASDQVAILIVDKNLATQDILKLTIVKKIVGENFNAQAFEKLTKQHARSLADVTVKDNKKAIVIPCRQDKYPLVELKEQEDSVGASFGSFFSSVASSFIKKRLPLELPGLTDAQNTQWAKVMGQLVELVTEAYMDGMLDSKHPFRQQLSQEIKKLIDKVTNLSIFKPNSEKLTLDMLKNELVGLFE